MIWSCRQSEKLISRKIRNTNAKTAPTKIAQELAKHKTRIFRQNNFALTKKGKIIQLTQCFTLRCLTSIEYSVLFDVAKMEIKVTFRNK